MDDRTAKPDRSAMAPHRPSPTPPAPSAASSPPTRWRRVGATLVLLTATTGVVLALVGALACVLGELISDRFLRMQWLAWIPVEAALAAAIMAAFFGGTGAAGIRLLRGPSRAGRRLRLVAVLSLLAAVGVTWFLLFVEHRAWRSPPNPPADAIRVMHWNARWPSPGDSPLVLRRLDELLEEYPADLLVLTQSGYLLLHGRAKHFTDAGWTVAESRPFTVVTRLPILELRRLVAFRGRHVTLLRLDTSATASASDAHGDRRSDLVIWLVDLPSSPHLARREALVEVRTELEQINAPEPDLLIGDLNNVRRSRALQVLAPGMRNAFALAGRGWSGTFPEWLPLWHIDHMLVADSIEAIDYLTIQTGVSDHRAQFGVFRFCGATQSATPRRSAEARPAAPRRRRVRPTLAAHCGHRGGDGVRRP